MIKEETTGTEGTVEFVATKPENAVEIGDYIIYAPQPYKQTIWDKVKRFTYDNRFMVGYALGTIVIVALFGFVSLVTPQ